MIESVRDNPNASIFGEPLGVVCFDPDMSKRMKEWNKSRTDNPKAFNHNQTLIQFVDWCTSLPAGERKFYCFHGEHRRAAYDFLHNVFIFLYIYHLV